LCRYGVARQQMVSNMDDARDTFKYLKSEVGRCTAVESSLSLP
jgi:hypothetical protein